MIRTLPVTQVGDIRAPDTVIVRFCLIKTVRFILAQPEVTEHERGPMLGFRVQ